MFLLDWRSKIFIAILVIIFIVIFFLTPGKYWCHLTPNYAECYCMVNPESCIPPPLHPSSPGPSFMKITEFTPIHSTDIHVPPSKEDPKNFEFLLGVQNSIEGKEGVNKPIINATISPIEISEVRSKVRFRGIRREIISEANITSGIVGTICNATFCNTTFYPGLMKGYTINYKVREAPEPGRYLRAGARVRYFMRTLSNITFKINESGRGLERIVSETSFRPISIEASLDIPKKILVEKLFGRNKNSKIPINLVLENEAGGYLKSDNLQGVRFDLQDSSGRRKTLNLTKEFKEKISKMEDGRLQRNESVTVTRRINLTTLIEKNPRDIVDISGSVEYIYTLQTEEYLKATYECVDDKNCEQDELCNKTIGKCYIPH